MVQESYVLDKEALAHQIVDLPVYNKETLILYSVINNVYYEVPHKGRGGGHPCYSGSALDGWSTGRAIDRSCTSHDS